MEGFEGIFEPWNDSAMYVMATRRAVGKPGKLARGASRNGLERNRERKYATQRSNYGVAEGGGRCGVQRRFRSVKRSRESAAYEIVPRMASIRHTRVFRGSHAIRDGRTANGGRGL